MRVDRDDRVEVVGQQPADDPLADRFAGRELDVLPHVAQVRRDQRNGARAVLPRRRGREQQLDELVVGMVEAATDRDVGGQRDGNRDAALAIRKAVDGNPFAGDREVRGEALRRRHVVVEAQDGACGGQARVHARWTPPCAALLTFALRAPVFALGAALRVDWSTFALRAPVFALGAALRTHASTNTGGTSAARPIT